MGRTAAPRAGPAAAASPEEPARSPPRPSACPAAGAAAEAVPRRTDGHGSLAAGGQGDGRNQGAVLTFPCLGVKLKGSPPSSCIFSC